MKSRYEYLQNPEDRRQVALFRSSASVTIVTALMFVAAFAPQGQPGDTVAVELNPSLVATPADSVNAPSVAAATQAGGDEFGNFDQLYPHAYMGQPGVLG